MSALGIKPKVEISERLVLLDSASSIATRMLSLSLFVCLQQHFLKRIPLEEFSLLPVLYSIMMFAPYITTTLTGGLGPYITASFMPAERTGQA